jgi:hypothetical protein
MAMTNDLLRKLYPDRFSYVDKEGNVKLMDRAYTKMEGVRWSSSMVDFPGRTINYKESTITSIGVGGAAQSGHYNEVFIDDPVGQKHIDSPVEMEKVFRWHDNTKELLDNPNHLSPDGSNIRIQCTFWGPGDYGSYVMEAYPEYHWRITPCLKDEALESTDTVKYVQSDVTHHMESNWEGAPGGKSKTEYYLAMMGNPEQEQIFWAQHMNNPKRATGLNKFDLSWIKYYSWEERDQGWVIICNDDKEEFFLPDIPLYGMIDPGGFSEVKLLKRGSRNALLIGGQPKSTRKKFVVYTYAGRLKKPSLFMDELFKAHKKWRPKLWKIEVFGQQGYIYKDIKEERTRRGEYLPITEMPKDVSRNVKDDDIQALINPLAQGEVYLHKSMKELITEIVNYPHGLTCDLLDMLGKIMKLNWSRRVIKPIEEMNIQSDAEYWDSRDSLTGY